MKKILISIIIFLVLLFSILLYSRFIGIKGLNVNEITVKDDIPIHYDGLKVVHFSDLHYKKIIGEKDVKYLISMIQKTKPDLVIFSGDLTDKDYQLTNQDINFLIKEFSMIDAKYGVYAVLGDQDVSNKETIQNIYLQSNITLLENQSTILQNEENEKIMLIGISSFVKHQANIKKALEGQSEGSFYKIAVVHEPDYTDDILKMDSGVSIILSSHSINGSFNIPIIKRLFLPKGATHYFNPYYEIGNTKLYISNGIGVNQINFRLFNRPSINFYRLKRK